jgi:hypothetical protein
LIEREDDDVEPILGKVVDLFLPLFLIKEDEEGDKIFSLGDEIEENEMCRFLRLGTLKSPWE